MVYTALFTAVLCALAPFSISIGPIPLSFATLAIYFAAGTLDLKYAAVSVILYIALGAFGLPVFSRFEGGFHKIAGPTGGFIIGYIPLALAVGLSLRLFAQRRLFYILGMVIGTVLLYTCGVAWYMLQLKATLAASLLVCVIPFLAGDAAKIAVAAIAAPQLRQAIRD